MPVLTLTCDLCGLERDPGAPLATLHGAAHGFCCAGCLNVYTILLESGMIQPGVDLRDTELFRRGLELGLVSKPARPKRITIPEGTATQERLYRISGMWCSACGWLIEHSLLAEPGVQSAEVYFASDLAKVVYYPQYLPPDRITARIGSLGYQAVEYRSGEQQTATDSERRDLTLRLGVAAFLWVNVMMLNLSVYVGIFQRLPDPVRDTLPFLVMLLAAPVIFYSAQPILRAAWTGLRAGVIRMETLLALGIVAAFGYSTVQAFRGESHIYFDISCAIVTLVLAGKQMERGAKEKATHAITSMYRMLPGKVRIVGPDSRERFVSIDALRSGAEFVVKAGERIPADGIVVDGEAHADESLLTGESALVAKSPGSRAVGGSLNTSGVLRIRATKVGEDSTLSQIVRTVENALMTRSRVERMVDRVSRAFVPFVISIAALTFAGWLLAGHIGFGDSLMRAITVLVIACPCALGIATPLALTAAVSAASRRGILVADSRVLETLRTVDTLVLDKTGTVTEGDFSLVDGDLADLALIASLEANSEHPLGRAIVAAARRRGLQLEPASTVRIHKGLGITGEVGEKHVFAGSRRLAPSISADLEARAAGWEVRGLTVAFYGWDGLVRGALAFGDRIKPDTREVIAALRARGIRTLLVSGDSLATTAWTAAEIGVDGFEAEVLPDQKAALLTRLQQEGRIVAMAGDGINDAPALAKANLGIAMASGAELAMKSAAVVIMKNQLGRILDAFEVATLTLRIIRQNLFWAFFYNTLGISFAIAGLLNPIVAAGAMVVSSLFVIGNSHRLSR